MINWDKFNTEKYFTKSYAGAHAINDKQEEYARATTKGLGATSATSYFGMIHRYRSPESIICELERNITRYGCNYITLGRLKFCFAPTSRTFC